MQNALLLSLVNFLDVSRRWARQKARDYHYTFAMVCVNHPMMMLFMGFSSIIMASRPVYWEIYESIMTSANSLQYRTESIYQYEAYGDPRPSQLLDQRVIDTFGAQPYFRAQELVISTKYKSDNGGKYGVGKGFMLQAMQVMRALHRIKVGVPVNETVPLDGHSYHSSFQRSLSAEPGNLRMETFTLEDICFRAKPNDPCFVLSPFEMWQHNASVLANDTNVMCTLTRLAYSSMGVTVPPRTMFQQFRFDVVENCVMAADSFTMVFFLEDKDFLDGNTTQLIWNSIVASLNSEFRSLVRNPRPISQPYFTLSQDKYTPTEFIFFRYSNDWRFDFLNNSGKVMMLFGATWLYIYITLHRRVQLTRSRSRFATAATLSIMCTMTASLGLCQQFFAIHLPVTMTWKVFPFVVVAVGVENIFVLIDGVTSTSMHLPVHERVGQGLAKVGPATMMAHWNQLLALAFGAYLPIPALAEFCLICSVALLFDYLCLKIIFLAFLPMKLRPIELVDFTDPKVQVALQEQYDKANQKEIAKSIPQKNRFWKTWKYSNFNFAWRSTFALIIVSIIIAWGLPILQASRDGYWNSPIPSVANSFWKVVDPMSTNKYIQVLPPLTLHFSEPSLLPDVDEFVASVGPHVTPKDREIFRSIKSRSNALFTWIQAHSETTFILMILFATIISPYICSVLRFLITKTIQLLTSTAFLTFGKNIICGPSVRQVANIKNLLDEKQEFGHSVDAFTVSRNTVVVVWSNCEMQVRQTSNTWNVGVPTTINLAMVKSVSALSRAWCVIIADSNVCEALVGMSDGSLLVVELDTMNVTLFKLSSSGVFSLNSMPVDCSLVYATHEDGHLSLWDTRSRRSLDVLPGLPETKQVSCDNGINDVAQTHSYCYFADSSCFWILRDQQLSRLEVKRVDSELNVTSNDYSILRDSSLNSLHVSVIFVQYPLLFAGQDDGTIKIFHLERHNNKALLISSRAAHSGPILKLEWLAQHKLLLSYGGNEEVKLWRMGRQSVLVCLRQNSAIVLNLVAVIHSPYGAIDSSPVEGAISGIRVNAVNAVKQIWTMDLNTMTQDSMEVVYRCHVFKYFTHPLPCKDHNRSPIRSFHRSGDFFFSVTDFAIDVYRYRTFYGDDQDMKKIE